MIPIPSPHLPHAARRNRLALVAGRGRGRPSPGSSPGCRPSQDSTAVEQVIEAAELLKISTRTLLRRIREYGMEDPLQPTAPDADEK